MCLWEQFSEYWGMKIGKRLKYIYTALGIWKGKP